MNTDIQNYRGLHLQVKERSDYGYKKAKEFHIISSKGYMTDITIWIPNSFMSHNDGTIDIDKNFMFIFNKSDVIEKLFRAGYEFTY